MTEWPPPADVRTRPDQPDPPELPDLRQGLVSHRRVPCHLRGRLTVSPRHLTALALAVGAALAVTAWVVIHSGSHEIARLVEQPTQSASVETGPLVALAAAPTPDAAPAPAACGTGVVSLNTADAVQLDAIPGVGPVTAGNILDWRTKHGRFSSVNELLEIDGIGSATLAKIRPHVSL